MDDCRGTCYVFGHFVENTAMNYLSYYIKAEWSIDSLKLPISNLSQAVVQNIFSLLRGLGRVSNNVHNRHELSIAASCGAYVGQLAWPEGRDDCADAVDSCVSVRSIA
jgi:hypothetical protein